MKKKQSWWRRLQLGQSTMEYWPTLGASVAFIGLSAWLALGVWDMYQQSVDAFSHVGVGEEVCVETQETAEGGSQDETTPTGGEGVGDTEALSEHTITLVGNSYDPGSDRTTIAYRIESGRRPSISHVTFGFADCLDIMQATGTTEWVFPDPRTGVNGFKFDDGFEDYEVRTVYVTVRGQVQMGNVEVATKAANQIDYGTITGPVACGAPEPDDTNADSQFEGCAPD